MHKSNWLAHSFPYHFDKVIISQKNTWIFPYVPHFMEEEGPKIIMKHCKQCGACAIECPEGAMVIDKKGYRVMVGGVGHRWHHIAKEVFKIGDEDKVIKALYNSIELLRKEAKSEEHLFHMVGRFGLEPIYKDL